MITITIELSDEEVALLLRLAASSNTTASDVATRLFRAEMNRRMHLLNATQIPPTAVLSETTTEVAEARETALPTVFAATPTGSAHDNDPFAHLDTSVFALDSEALKIRFEREASDFDIWWNGLPELVCEGVRESMQQSSEAASKGQLSSASGLYIRMRE